MRQRQHAEVEDLQLGLGWYTREGWEQLVKLADDPEVLDESFDAWERGAISALLELEGAGRCVHKVPVDVEALCAWCGVRGRPLNAAARTEYVSELLRKRKPGQ